MIAADAALVELLGRLDALGYDFITVTPASHARVVARSPGARASNLRDVFGWSRPFAPGLLPAGIEALLDRAGVLDRSDELLRSMIRVSRVAGHLFIHSAFPTDRSDSVFLGPDTYRFVRFLENALARSPPVSHLIDIGTGSGAGAICAASLVAAARLTGVDCNAQAVRFATVNAAAAGVQMDLIEADTIDAVTGEFDLVIANPPFMIGGSDLVYRHGGGDLGIDLALEWVRTAAARLGPGGRILLYTGSPIIDGRDRLKEILTNELGGSGFNVDYREIDPDIFGEELATDGYRQVDRIASVGAAIVRA